MSLELPALALGAAATVLAYLAAQRLQRALGQRPWLNPALVAACALAGTLVLLGLPQASFAPTAQVFGWLLGPHVVLLAVPLYRFRHELIQSCGLIVLAVVTGGLAASGFALATAVYFYADDAVAITLATKSVTTAVAVALAEVHGGLPQLASLVVVLTGIFGACVVALPLRCFGAPCPMAQGLALGISAHALGTARALQLDERMGAFASLGMILNALATALWLPLVLAGF